MKCPTENDCDIVFIQEENDSGDSNTPYFMSWTSYIYDEESSIHAPECPGLTQEQIEQIEKEYNEDSSYSYLED